MRYIEEHFLKYVPGREDDPILLLLDGLKSHTSVGLVDWAITHNIILFVLPVHTSHFLQPLDVGCYGPFHRIFNNECHKEMKNLSTVITKYNICEIACRGYSKALSAENLRHAFRRTGIFPLERIYINSDYLVPAQVFTCLENIHGKEKENEEDDVDDETNHQEDDIFVPGPIDHVSQLEVTENDITGPAGDNSEEIVIQEIRTPLPDMTGTFFTSRVATLKRIKSEHAIKSRNTMSKITSGHCITEENVRDKMLEHHNKYSTNKKTMIAKETKTNKKRNTDCQKTVKGEKSEIYGFSNARSKPYSHNQYQ